MAQHKISEINTEKLTGTCSVDGMVKVVYNGKNRYGVGYYQCSVIKYARLRSFKYNKKYGIEGIPIGTTCELCKGSVRIAYDHDHKTGSFRGWLCMKCNTALGLVNDDVELLKRMIQYLER